MSRGYILTVMAGSHGTLCGQSFERTVKFSEHVHAGGIWHFYGVNIHRLVLLLVLSEIFEEPNKASHPTPISSQFEFHPQRGADGLGRYAKK